MTKTGGTTGSTVDRNGITHRKGTAKTKASQSRDYQDPFEHIHKEVISKPFEVEDALSLPRSTINLLQPNEQRAIREYSDVRTYQKINGALRSGDVAGEIAEQIQNLDIALKKLPNAKGIVYRDELVVDGEHKRHLDSLSVGESYSDSAYLSTDIEGVPQYFSGNYHFTIESKTGKYIGNLNRMYSQQGEREVLFERGSNFTVLKKEIINNETYFILEQQTGDDNG